jgi:phosphatidate phosphatase APP1
MIKKLFNKWLKWSEEPYVKIYRGFATESRVFIHGHLFKGLSLHREKPSTSFFRNAKEMIKRFVISPWGQQRLRIYIADRHYDVKTRENGYFTLELEGKFSKLIKYQVQFIHDDFDILLDREIVVEPDTGYVVVSDVDDTIIISHATNVLKKLYLLLARNPQQRRPFEGVVNSYCRLDHVPFFFVSSSEWNLYDFIVSFCEYHKFPFGYYLLQDIKQWKDLVKSGGGDHMHKYDKIVFLMKFFERSKFVLIGDSGQRDARIYTRLANEFPEKVASIHIRDIRAGRHQKVEKVLQSIKSKDVRWELFRENPTFIDMKSTGG